MLYGERDETINHLISACSKLEHKEYQTRFDWVGKVVHMELCKTSKFDHKKKWYIQNPESTWGMRRTSSTRILRYNHHHHHDAPPARISLTLSRHFSLSFIASGRSSGLHPVSSHSCCMYVRAGRPTLAHPYVGVHRSTSLMSSSLLLHQ